MKKHKVAGAGVQTVLLFFLCAGACFGWGDQAHVATTRAACKALPGELGTLFRTNEDFLAYHSLDPDIRANKEKALPPEERLERPGHYIDIDLYGRFPFGGVPDSYEEAVRRYGKEAVWSWGVLPWRVEEYSERMVKAMRAGEWESALLAGANLSHYVADAHVPFHYTYNYNGQFTGNFGIHARFDVELAKRVLKKRRLGASLAEDDLNEGEPAQFIFRIVPEAYVWIDNILLADMRAREAAGDYGEEYYRRMEELVGDIAYERMNAAASRIAAMWLKAWEKAGKPKPPADLELRAELVHSYSD